jgi:hypothetical protein
MVISILEISFYYIILIILIIINRIRLYNIFENIQSKRDLLYLNQRDFCGVIMEMYKRKGYDIKQTAKCGVENGFVINGLQFAEAWKNNPNKQEEIETAMNLEKCMRINRIYRGIFITLGDFKVNTRKYCGINVIECINGDRLLDLIQECQRDRSLAQIKNSCR